jgi:AcrR family transcriptional regulator
MARLRSPQKRAAILEAAAREIAESGLGAPTAKIASRAGIAAGTLFTYFASKEELLNELYLELKSEVYTRVNADFPHQADLKARASHIWSVFLEWAVQFPEKRKASVQLNVSDLITPTTRALSSVQRGAVDATLDELDRRIALHGLPHGFAAAAMAALQEATMDFIARQPTQRNQLSERAFELLWRAIN